MSKKPSWIEKLHRIKRYVVSDVWDIEVTSLSALRSLGIKMLRVIHLVCRGFREDECPLHASALTFNTLLAVVPILALSLALAGAFGGRNVAEKKLRELAGSFTGQFDQPSTNAVVGTNSVPDSVDAEADSLSPTPAAPTNGLTAEELNSKVDAILEQAASVNFTALGSLGFILLIWMVVAVLSKVEASFNRVWGVSVGRPMFRKFTDYLFAVIVLPFLITMASSLKIAELVAKVHPPTAARLSALLESGAWSMLMVLVLTLLTFMFTIKFMPNTKVRLRPALAGGFVAAILFLFWLWFCARLQVGVAKYSPLYGSFAIVPIVLFWVFVSWEIVLFGAEVAFAVQNCTTYRMEQGARRANTPAKIIMALAVVVETAKVMTGKQQHFDVAEFARAKEIPVRFLNEIVDELVRAGYLGNLAEHDGEFVLLRSPSTISIKEVIDAIMHSGVVPDDLGLARVDPRFVQIVKTVTGGVGGSARDSTIDSLLQA